MQGGASVTKPPLFEEVDDRGRYEYFRKEWFLNRNEIQTLQSDVEGLKRLARAELINKLRITVAEIWSWAVGVGARRQGMTDQGSLYDVKIYEKEVQAVADAIKFNDMVNFRALVRKCFKERDEAVHFFSLRALEEAVLTCLDGLKTFPDIKSSNTELWKGLKSYNTLKKELPHFFKSDEDEGQGI